MEESAGGILANESAGGGSRGSTIKWYRTSLDRETLARLNAKSDLRGYLQACGHLGLLLLIGSASLYSYDHWPVGMTVGLVFVFGTAASFAINAVHELVHRSVFRTPWLNELFVRIFSIPGWINYVHFAASHKRHHQYTLHPPDDLEVVLPIRLMVRDFFFRGFINPRGLIDVIRNTVRLSVGRFEGEWERALFPAERPDQGRPVIVWARFLLVSHCVILAVSLSFGWYLLPVLTSFSPGFGAWLFFLCNNTQHIGLQDNVPDFRLCCRTFILNPVVGFLYWHMNYHTEHHMYAAVPCYNLGKLHRAILHDLPPCPNGLLATWREIAAIQKRQDQDPTYQHRAALPG